MATVPRQQVRLWDYEALQENAGWALPMEYLDGEVFVMVPTGGAHGAVHAEVHGLLRAWQDSHHDGGVVLLDTFVHVGGSRPAPDLSYWSAERRPTIELGAVRSVPDLVVEVLSPKSRANDQGFKRELYLREGVREVWIADPEARTIAVHRGDERRVLREGDTLTSPLLPGFAMPVAAAFAQLG